MDTKPLLFGIIGFIAGGLLVSVAATSFEAPGRGKHAAGAPDSMSSMVSELRDKHGDDFDKAFIEEMIMHHEGAIDMAEMAESQAKHQEVKEMSKAIVEAQRKEVETMKRWQHDWGYEAGNDAQGH